MFEGLSLRSLGGSLAESRSAAAADGPAQNSELVSSKKRLADSTSKKMSMELHGDVMAYLRSEGHHLQHRVCVTLTQQAVFNDFLQKQDSGTGN